MHLFKQWSQFIWPSLLILSLSAQGQGVSDKEQEKLKAWGNHQRANSGTLLNPPTGKVSPQIKNTVNYIDSIIKSLAGDRLKQEKIKLTISLYSGRAMNAFMGGYHSEQDKRGFISTIGRFLGYDKNQNSMYELGINVGLLNQLTFEDELAFIIGHELGHLFEGHTEVKEGKQKAINHWWSSQSNEATVDLLSLDMMKVNIT